MTATVTPMSERFAFRAATADLSALATAAAKFAPDLSPAAATAAPNATP